MKKLDDSALLVARVLMFILFIVVGCRKLGVNYAGTQQYMVAIGMPGFLLPLIILLEVGGGLAVLFGLLRSVALSAVVFTLLKAFIFHPDFNQTGNQINFMKNLIIAGDYFLLAVNGPGAFSIDCLLAKRIIAATFNPPTQANHGE